MSEITFSCPSCGEMLEATSDAIGATVECPTCNTEFEVPAEDDAPRSVIAAALAAAAEASHGCPNCDQAMEEGAVLCMQCGFHTGLGKVIETNFG